MQEALAPLGEDPPPIIEPSPEAQSRTGFRRIDTNALMATRFATPRMVVPGCLPEGFSVLAGRQKLGKTWLAMDWAIAVATAGLAMGAVACDQGDVVYIDLENGGRRIQHRIDTFFPDPKMRPDLSRLEWVTDAPELNKGFIQALEDWRQSVEKPTMAVIDVLQRIKPAGLGTRNAYENDYSIWSPLQSWAIDRGVAVLGLHHTKKGGAEDPLEALSGSNGLSACADTTIVLDRGSAGITLYVRGRDVAEKEDALDFAGGLWTVKGSAADVHRTTERQKILAALKDTSTPMSMAEISDATGMTKNNLRQLLFKMVKAGEVIKPDRGCYQHPVLTPDNNDNKITNRDESYSYEDA